MRPRQVAAFTALWFASVGVGAIIGLTSLTEPSTSDTTTALPPTSRPANPTPTPGPTTAAPRTTPSAHPTAQLPAYPTPDTVQVDQAPDPLFYPNCDAVRAVGAAPLLAGQPGYREGLDDRGGQPNGIACEVRPRPGSATPTTPPATETPEPTSPPASTVPVTDTLAP
jgi:hypothetical protein